MAVTRDSRSVKLTAAGDAVTQYHKVKEVWFFGAGLTAGQSIVLKDKASGNVIAQGVTLATNDNQVLRHNCFDAEGLYLDTIPASGGTVIVYYE